MYTSFFGLSEKPFAITPNPRYLYMSEKHAEALAHLVYGLNEAGGFIQLTGEVGTGKTTVVRTLLEQLPQHTDVAVILNPRLSPTELLLTICEELGIFLSDANAHSQKDLVDELNAYLLTAHSKGRRVVVIIDEAQNLQPETLEQVRLLTNLETTTHKLMQIILIGQPELRELLARNDLRQLAQRITGRYHLAPLNAEDTAAYVRHRLQVAGAVREIFTETALKEVHALSRGVPRLINVICDRALLGAYTQQHPMVELPLVRAAALEVTGITLRSRWRVPLLTAGVVSVASMALGLTLWLRPNPAPAPAPVSAAASSSSVAQSAAPAVLDAGAALTLFADTGTDAALATLFGLWQVPYHNGERACEQASAQQLSCVYDKGNWSLLRSLNRPVILQLTDEQGLAHQVVLVAVDATRALLQVGETRQTVTVASLSRFWNGDFLLLWQPKVNSTKPLLPGMRGVDVQWLRHALATWQGVPNNTPRADYDKALSQTVAEFQRAMQLTADGLAGLQTQIALDAATSMVSEPTLQWPVTASDANATATTASHSTSLNAPSSSSTAVTAP